MAWIRHAMFLAVLWVCTVLAHAGKSADDTACSVPEHECLGNRVGGQGSNFVELTRI